MISSPSWRNFRSSPVGDPWATNVDGTERLLDLRGALDVPEFHHVFFVNHDEGFDYRVFDILTSLGVIVRRQALVLCQGKTDG